MTEKIDKILNDLVNSGLLYREEDSYGLTEKYVKELEKYLTAFEAAGGDGDDDVKLVAGIIAIVLQEMGKMPEKEAREYAEVLYVITENALNKVKEN